MQGSATQDERAQGWLWPAKQRSGSLATKCCKDGVSDARAASSARGGRNTSSPMKLLWLATIILGAPSRTAKGVWSQRKQLPQPTHPPSVLLQQPSRRRTRRGGTTLPPASAGDAAPPAEPSTEPSSCCSSAGRWSRWGNRSLIHKKPRRNSRTRQSTATKPRQRARVPSQGIQRPLWSVRRRQPFTANTKTPRNRMVTAGELCAMVMRDTGWRDDCGVGGGAGAVR